MERNIRLLLEYDGTDYVGWQRQPSSHGMSVQEAVERALERLCKQPVRLIGAGRTDAGVHAAGQVANFHSSCSIPAERIPLALRGLLPDDIVVRRAEDVPADFHARYDAKGKTYRYLICPEQQPGAFSYRYAWWLSRCPDLVRMQAAAEKLVGFHDFMQFSARGSSAQTFGRTVRSCRVYRQSASAGDFPWQSLPEGIVLEITADGFLYKMVRMIVGTLVEIGLGKRPVEAVDEILLQRQHASAPAPAAGLVMLRVDYGEGTGETVENLEIIGTDA